MYLEYIDQFTIDILLLVFTLLWIFAFVYWVAEGFRVFLRDVLELRKR